MWQAQFKDDSILRQFEEGREVIFREVLNRQEELKCLCASVGNVMCSVNLGDGSFIITKDGTTMRFFMIDRSIIPPPEYKYRVVYFQRCLQLFDAHLRPSTGEQIQCTAIGWQATTNDGKNLKRIVKLYPNDTFDVETE